jgi:hypothetical protein
MAVALRGEVVFDAVGWAVVAGVGAAFCLWRLVLAMNGLR